MKIVLVVGTSTKEALGLAALANEYGIKAHAAIVRPHSRLDVLKHIGEPKLDAVLVASLPKGVTTRQLARSVERWFGPTKIVLPPMRERDRGCHFGILQHGPLAEPICLSSLKLMLAALINPPDSS